MSPILRIGSRFIFGRDSPSSTGRVSSRSSSTVMKRRSKTPYGVLNTINEVRRCSTMSLNKVMLIGNLGHDPEIRYMPASKRAVPNLSIAMNDSFTDRSGNRQERTDWLTVVAYGKLAELCHQHLKKGRQVYVEGSIRVREYEP